jgi:hypothetical protein
LRDRMRCNKFAGPRCQSFGGFTGVQRRFRRVTEVVVYKYKVGGSLRVVALSRKALLIRYYTQVQ